MDFFTHQETARRRSLWLILGFIVAVIVLVVAVDTVAVGIATLARGGLTPTVDNAWPVVALATAAVLVLVGLGSLAKMSSLSAGGGDAIALRLGGRRISASDRDPADRRLMNVVEEMALASGVPTPTVYVLEDQKSINAFAAGLKTGDAIVGVTRGTLDQLDRDELQGVIGHEFSHILNGDMRLNLRLIGLIHGILVMAIAGRIIMYSLRHVRVKGKGGAVIAIIFLVGLALFVLGYVGYFAGQILRAALNRQREYLADAAAVQFTRNPRGLSGAFQKLLDHGTRIRHATTSEVSHLFFGNALRRPFFGFLATHPPLEDRLDRIDPGWRDRPAPEPASPRDDRREDRREEAPRAPRRGGIPGMGVPPLLAADVAGLVGQLDASSPEEGAEALAALPRVVQEACGEPFSARAAVLAAIADPRPQVAATAVEDLADVAGSQLASEMVTLYAQIASLEPGGALSVVLLAVPTLRSMSPRQRRAFVQMLEAFTKSDGVVTLHEYALAELVAFHLEVRPEARERVTTAAIRQAQAELLAVIARAEAPTEEAAGQAFALGSQHVTLDGGMPQKPTSSRSTFHHALQVCRRASPAIRQRLVTAVAWTVSADGVVSATEEELLRLVADSLDCPIPRFTAPGTEGR